MKILCLGHGLVGREFERYGIQTIGREALEIGVDDIGLPRFYENLNMDLIETLSSSDVIINCIGYTNTKQTTLEEYNRSLTVNSVFVGQLAEYCTIRDKKLVHISTGDVYGDSLRTADTRAFKETDTNTIHNMYTSTKYIGEKFVGHPHIIVRPRLIFGVDTCNANLCEKIYKYNSFSTALNSFCSTSTLVEAVLELIQKDAYGVFNVCNASVTSMLALAELVRDNFESNKVIKTAEFADSINNCMDHSKLEPYYIPRFVTDEFLSIYEKFLYNK